MKPATSIRTRVEDQRLLVIDRAKSSLAVRRFSDVARLAQPTDVWVLNDAATLPASLAGTVHSQPIELRLAGTLGSARFFAVLFGKGSWRDDTDRRPPPPRVNPGDRIRLGGELSATVDHVDARWPRLLEVTLQPDSDRFWSLLFRLGQPIQYSYLQREHGLASFQTPYASRPWAVELPSAGRLLTPRVLAALKGHGATVVTLTHAAGLSATGDHRLDAALPLPERYEIPKATARVVERARRGDHRIVAVGTSTARALEGSLLLHGEVHPGEGTTDLRLGPGHTPQVVSALLTGAHDPQSSHYELLRSFVDDELLSEAVIRSEEVRLLGHEFGDSWIVV